MQIIPFPSISLFESDREPLGGCVIHLTRCDYKKSVEMESQTPVILTGVRLDESCIAEQISQVKNKAGILCSHQVHSTVTTL